jgi:hypothetical protein
MQMAGLVHPRPSPARAPPIPPTNNTEYYDLDGPDDQWQTAASNATLALPVSPRGDHAPRVGAPSPEPAPGAPKRTAVPPSPGVSKWMGTFDAPVRAGSGLTPERTLSGHASGATSAATSASTTPGSPQPGSARSRRHEGAPVAAAAAATAASRTRSGGVDRTSSGGLFGPQARPGAALHAWREAAEERVGGGAPGSGAPRAPAPARAANTAPLPGLPALQLFSGAAGEGNPSSGPLLAVGSSDDEGGAETMSAPSNVTSGPVAAQPQPAAALEAGPATDSAAFALPEVGTWRRPGPTAAAAAAAAPQHGTPSASSGGAATPPSGGVGRRRGRARARFAGAGGSGTSCAAGAELAALGGGGGGHERERGGVAARLLGGLWPWHRSPSQHASPEPRPGSAGSGGRSRRATPGRLRAAAGPPLQQEAPEGPKGQAAGGSRPGSAHSAQQPHEPEAGVADDASPRRAASARVPLQTAAPPQRLVLGTAASAPGALPAPARTRVVLAYGGAFACTRAQCRYEGGSRKLLTLETGAGLARLQQQVAAALGAGVAPEVCGQARVGPLLGRGRDALAQSGWPLLVRVPFLDP